VTEAVEFDVPEAGAPNLGDEGRPEQEQPQQPFSPVIVTGWTAEEAARVVGGMVAGLTTALYVVKHQAPPPAELVPYIAGDPPREFPLLGAGLAPILDSLAPKGSAAAVGVSLGAGISELMGAMARRMPVLATPPKQEQRAQQPPPQQAPAEPPPDGGFRYAGDQLRVLQGQDGYSAMGFE
jgi:hypothetical protein